jgi:hypothetical protein
LQKPLGTVKGLVRSALKSLRGAMLPGSHPTADKPAVQSNPSERVRHDL